jgi:ubiquitin-protein ligase
MNAVRERRLQSDYVRLSRLTSTYKSEFAIETTRGTPPETYLMMFKGRSIAEVKGNDVVFCRQQHLKIEMGAEYPAMPPLVTMLTSIFHPHVWPQNNVVCLGPWNITETLDNLVIRLYSIVVFDPTHINWKSVANQEAAVWASRNQHLFPLDRLRSTDTLSSIQTRQDWYESA